MGAAIPPSPEGDGTLAVYGSRIGRGNSDHILQLHPDPKKITVEPRISMFGEYDKANMQNVRAAQEGCGECGGPLKLPSNGIPAGDPFSAGRYQGRYLCGDCWTLYYDEHPEELADQESRRFVSQEADRIRVERGLSIEVPEMLFQEGDSRAHLMPNGTVRIQIARTSGIGSEEFDPARFQILVRALRAIDQKGVSGFTFLSAAGGAA
jgi:hypothetical protein